MSSLAACNVQSLHATSLFAVSILARLFAYLLAGASVFAITAKLNTGLHTLSAGINGGGRAANQFKPYANFRKEGSSGSSLENLKLSEIRSDRLLDSGVSGLITGGTLRGFTGGIRSISPGAVSDVSEWAERLLQAIGIKPLSDAVYLASLKKQRTIHSKRIAELEDEIKQEIIVGAFKVGPNVKNLNPVKESSPFPSRSWKMRILQAKPVFIL
ncbi:hypothetical protein BDP27DRAFT_1426469 [Rhodocollybia butyracea]|uniref:Uncharacterized protein n=1 Tax=Rhodocollybia butyracea TaxID=206335 RepID=A0A9P5U3K5_9AGAR|nr:hypothetical protein BDP27DRAFT_1426469 [Rhodocollybia butyracea]